MCIKYSININHTQFSIQNKHSLNFLEIKEFNETSCQLTCTQKDFKKSVYFQAVFKLVKIFEVIDIKPEHLKIIEKNISFKFLGNIIQN